MEQKIKAILECNRYGSTLSRVFMSLSRFSEELIILESYEYDTKIRIEVIVNSYSKLSSILYVTNKLLREQAVTTDYLSLIFWKEYYPENKKENWFKKLFKKRSILDA